MDAIEAAWTQVEAPQSSALAVRSSDLQPAERLDLVPVIYENLPAQYQTQENYRDLELRARQDPKSLDRAIELTGQSVPQLVHYSNYHLTTTHTDSRPTYINFNPQITVKATASTQEEYSSGWWFIPAVLLCFFLALAVGGE